MIVYKKIDIPQPIGYLNHKTTHSRFPVYHKISWFKKLMFNWFFGLKYDEEKK